MPEASLTRTIDEAKKADVSLTIRGMKDNSMKNTAVAVQKLKAQIDINPLLFTKFGIKKVPAVVFAKGKCDSNSCAVIRENDFFVIYGDVTLDYALEKMATLEPDLSVKIEPILAKLKGSFYTK